MAKFEKDRSSAVSESFNLSPAQKVLLIAGPAGSGKTSMARRIAEVNGWLMISEDRLWDELPREPHTFRTDEEKAIVQARVVDCVTEELRKGNSVVLEFIVYDNPPQPIIFYQGELLKLEVPVHVKVLRPSVDEILARQGIRGNAHDTEREIGERRRNAEHQLRCLSSKHIQPSWVVDSSRTPIEEVYRKHFADLVELTDGNG